MTNETNPAIKEPIYVSPTVLCRISLTREEIKIESATIEHDGVRALQVFPGEEEANDWLREALSSEKGMKAIPAADEHLQDLLAMHGCTHVVTPVSFLGDDSVDLFSAEDFMYMLKEGVPA